MDYGRSFLHLNCDEIRVAEDIDLVTLSQSLGDQLIPMKLGHSAMLEISWKMWL